MYIYIYISSHTPFILSFVNLVPHHLELCIYISPPTLLSYSHSSISFHITWNEVYIYLLPHSIHTLRHQSPSTSQLVVSRRYGEPGFKSDLNHPPHISFTHTTHVLKGCYKIPRRNRNWLRKMTKISSKLPKEFFEPSSYDFHTILTRFSHDFHNIFTYSPLLNLPQPLACGST